MKHIIRTSEELFHHRTGHSVNAIGQIPTTGYMVSLPDYEVKIDSDNTDVLLYNIQQFVKHHFHLVQYSRSLYFGIWENKGIYYLDISEQYQDKEVALREAKINKQIAIYDVRRRTSIKV